jgi:hypothetical protein
MRMLWADHGKENQQNQQKQQKSYKNQQKSTSG